MNKVFLNLVDHNVLSLIKDGAIGVIPTDTVYGIITRADNPASITRLYEIRGRDPKKSSIVLVSSIGQIPGLSDVAAEKYLKMNDQQPTTIVTKVPKEFLSHLPKQSDTLAFRLVNTPNLNELIDKIGPIIAPSANLEGQPTASNIAEAQAYFGEKIDFYVDGGDLSNRPASKIVSINSDQSVVVYR